MPHDQPKQSYSREDVRRVLGVSERQLRSWEKQKFLTASQTFDFSGLLALKTLVALRTSKIAAAHLRKVLDAIRERLGDVGNPLTELKIYRQGKHLVIHFAGRKMEPISGQLLLDFDAVEIKRLLAFPGKSESAQNAAALRKNLKEAEQWFEKGLELEQSGALVEEVIEAYKKACELDPGSAGAFVNLGTVYYNARAWKDAEREYRKALAVDPKYALAHYNLGNLCDERGDRALAIEFYRAALQIRPEYPDAHYNMALVYQGMGQTLQAVQHWKTYLKLDPDSSWAKVARRELGKLRESTVLRGNREG